jgi:serine/threonine-protein kinase
VEIEEHGATLVDRPGKSPPSTSAPAKSSTTFDSSTVTSPLEALARDEVFRTRNYCYMAFGMVAGGLAAIPFLPSGYYETRVFAVALVVVLWGQLYMLLRTRDPTTFHQGNGVAICWVVCSAAVSCVVPWGGPYSPVPIVPMIGIYFVGLGQRPIVAFLVYAISALTELVFGVLAITGVAQTGMIHVDQLPRFGLIIAQALVQMVFVAGFFIARASRGASLAALAELQSAVRAVAQREALLQEAREELRRALGSGRGRFSEQTIGHYRLGEVIGRGAMGEVYAGVDPRDGRQVAVKMLSQTSLGNADHIKRFLRELETAVAIDSPNVVRVLAIGEEPLPHLVMERLQGRDLSSILRDQRVLPHAAVVDLLRQLGDGITAAAAVGIIHRDLKPQNVFFADPTWKILDFGVARLAEAGDTLTAGHVVGTPSYMAPEQARGAPIDHRADLYALAAIAYRCLTGHALHVGGEVAEVLYRVVHTAPRRPSTLASLPDDVDLVLAIALAKQPTDRFSTAAELTSAMAAAFEGSLPESIRKRGRALETWAS